MPKLKNHIVKKNSDYFYVAIDILICVICVILIGRIGTAGSYLALIFSFVLGDFSTIILAFILIYSIVYILFKKKIDFHHIFVIGGIFIFLSLLIFTHLGLYDALGMNNTDIIPKTVQLYKNYLKHYEISFSCGGGIIGALLLQIICLLVGKIGSILVAICFILIGISFFTNLNLMSLFKGGRFTEIFKKTYCGVKKYFINMHFPSPNNYKRSKGSIKDLTDYEGNVSFTLQEEINKEKYEDFKRFIKERKIYCLLEGFHTSFSSSRFIIKFAQMKEEDTRILLSFFNRQAFFIKKNNDCYLDYSNQFRKLLTLKNLLSYENLNKKIPLAMDINGDIIDLNVNVGRLILILGDNSSGIKTFIRALVVSILLKNIDYNEIYLYDFNNDFSSLSESNIKYVNNERSASIALDSLFNEYERRCEVLKYFNCDDIEEVNSLIKKNASNNQIIKPEIHILYLDLNSISASLLQKIVYAIRFSIKVGITIVLVSRGNKALDNIEINKCDLVCFNISDVSLSLKLFGSDMACKLQKKGDVILRINGAFYHGQTPYISISDFESITKK